MGLICIDLRDSDGALVWQCWELQRSSQHLSHPFLPFKLCRPTGAMQPARSRPSQAQPAKPVSAASSHTNRPLHLKTSLPSRQAAPSVLEYTSCRGRGEGSAPHRRGQCILFVSHRVASKSDRNQIAVLPVKSGPVQVYTRPLTNGAVAMWDWGTGGMGDCGIKMAMVI
jgi:hypothetical protein